MTSALLPLVATLFSLLSANCAAPGGGRARTLGHSYQDPRGVTFASVFEIGAEVRGACMTMGLRETEKKLRLPPPEFEALWNRLDESKLTGYAVTDPSRPFDMGSNIVVIKGMMPGHTTTYVVPKTKASPALQTWARDFRTKTGA